MAELWPDEYFAALIIIGGRGSPVQVALTAASATASTRNLMARTTYNGATSWAPVVTAATDVAPDDWPGAAAEPEASGRIRGFYVNAAGTLQTVYSDDCGKTWT